MLQLETYLWNACHCGLEGHLINLQLSQISERPLSVGKTTVQVRKNTLVLAVDSNFQLPRVCGIHRYLLMRL